MELGFLVVVILVACLLVYNEVDSVSKRIRTIDHKLNFIIDHLGIEYDPFKKMPSELVQLLNSGNKLKVIKLYRQLYGASLKEASDFYERYKQKNI